MPLRILSRAELRERESGANKEIWRVILFEYTSRWRSVAWRGLTRCVCHLQFEITHVSTLIIVNSYLCQHFAFLSLLEFLLRYTRPAGAFIKIMHNTKINL